MVAGDGSSSSSWSSSPERNRQRAARRSASETRRYVVANGLTDMWVLTMAGEGLHGPDGFLEMKRQVARMIDRRLRPFVGKDFAYWHAPELHPKGHGWHDNLMVPKGLVRHEDMTRLWGRGYVWVRDWTVGRENGRRVRFSGREGARRAAGYGTKYVVKDFGSAGALPGGTRRYERAGAFIPAQVEGRGDSRADVWAQAVGAMGGRAADVVRVMELEEPTWDGPPCTFLAWS